MGKWCRHASSFIFDQIVIKVAGNQDRHKSSDDFDFGPLVSMAHLYVFWNEIWPWHIGLRWAIVALWATCWFIFSWLWYTHVIRIRGCNWMYFEPHRLADVLWLLKIICNLYYFSCRNNSEISESFAVGHEITAKIMTYGIYCLYRYNNPLRDETMW